MFTEYKLKANGYIQNDGEPESHRARVELSANPQFVGDGCEKVLGKPPGNYVILRMLDTEKLKSGDHKIAHIGLTLSLDEAELFANWLLQAVTNGRSFKLPD